MTAVQVFDPAELRRVFGTFPTGVTAVAALIDGEPVGLAASSFTSVSLEPALVSVCIARSSTTWPVLRAGARLGISVLSAEQERTGRQLSGQSDQRFLEVDWRATDDGGVLLEGAGAWLDCSIEQEVPAGDHIIVVLRVHDFDADHDVRPLVFHASRFHRLEV